MRANLIAGLDIGTTKTCAVIAEVRRDDRGRPSIQVLGVGQAKTEGMRGEVVTHTEETTETIRTALKEAELMSGCTVDRVYAGISGGHIEATASLGVVAVGREEITKTDLARVHEVARAVAIPPDREVLHAIPQDYRVDNQGGIVDPTGMEAVRLETDVYLVTCSSTAAENIRRAVSKAGYRVQRLELEPLASSRSVLSEDEKEVGVAMVEIGGGTTDIAVFTDGKIRHLRILPLGGITVTSDLSRGLSIPFAEAERAKERYGAAVAAMVDPTESVDLPGPAPGQTRTVTRELIAHVMEQRVDEMLGMVLEELEQTELLGRLGAGIVLTGGGAAMTGVMELANQVFPTPVRVGVPGEGLTGLADAVGRPRFATAAGLALRGADRFFETGEGASTFASGWTARALAGLKEFF
jgi:cell division protein FtsA